MGLSSPMPMPPTTGMTPDQTLIGLICQVSPRFVIEYANANRFYSMLPASADLSTLLGQVGPRFVIEYANANKFYNLTAAPSELITLIGQVAPRFVLQYANANKFYTLGYPGALVGDTQAPPSAMSPSLRSLRGAPRSPG